MEITTKRALYIIAIICFIALAVALLTAYKSPASGYELSIYAATPLAVWILIMISLLGGVTLIVHQAITKGYKDSRLWVIGFVILLLSRIAILYLPYIRGYLTWKGDHLSHLGILKDILSTGHLASDNYYPVTHALLSQVTCVTGISEIIVANLATAMFSIIYILSTYLLATAIFSERGKQLLATVLAAPLGFWVYLMPEGWAMLFSPLLFFCYFKRSILSYRILFVILLVLYPFFHPLFSFIVIIALLVIGLSGAILTSKARQGKSVIRLLASQLDLNYVLVVLVIWLAWILSFQVFSSALPVLWHQITTGASTDVLGGIGATLAKINVYGFDFVILLFKMYGVTIIYIALSFSALFLLIRRIRSDNISRETLNVFSLLTLFLFEGLLYLLTLLRLPGLSAISMGRVLVYMMTLPAIFAAFSIYELLKMVNFSRLAGMVIICLVMLASALSIFSLYSSPYIIQPSIQVTQMEMTGMTWFIDHKDLNTACVHIMVPTHRFAPGVLGKAASLQRADLRRTELPPDHFGYTEHNNLGELYAGDMYAVIGEAGRIIYVTVWQEVGRFNEADFERMEGDPTLGKLYANGELDVYLIHGIGSQ